MRPPTLPVHGTFAERLTVRSTSVAGSNQFVLHPDLIFEERLLIEQVLSNGEGVRKLMTASKRVLIVPYPFPPQFVWHGWDSPGPQSVGCGNVF